MRWAAAAVLMACVGVPTLAEGQAAPPVATLSAGSGAPGSTVLVVGENWPASSVVQAQVCGNQALNGSADCLRSAAVTRAADQQGNWNADVPVLVPPTPCPCVVYVTSGGTAVLRLPFEVLGVPTATPRPASANAVVYTVSEIGFAGDDSLGSLLGGEGERTASLTVTNTGSDVITTLPVEVRVAGTSATSAPTAIGPLTPGQSVSIQLPVTIPALTFGTIDLDVVVGNGSQGVNRSASVTTYPWLLILLAALVVLGLGVLVAVLLARRTSAAWEPGPEHRPVTPPELSSVPAAAAAAAVADAGASAATVPPTGLDMASLEHDLAEELGRALAVAGPIGADETPELLAASVAAEVAAAVGARHDLASDAIEALVADLRTSLATELGAVASAAR